jgi:sortase B
MVVIMHKNIIKKLGILLMVLVIVACVPLTIPRLFGYQEYTVVSGSMEPKLPVGSLVFVKHVNPHDLRVKDIIAFESGDVVVTHRIVSLDLKSKEIITKGDANDVSDATPVTYKKVLGKVTGHLPLFGKFAAALSGVLGKIIAFVILLVGVYLSDIGEFQEKYHIKISKDLFKKKVKPKTFLILGLVIIFGSLAGMGFIFWGYEKSDRLYESIEEKYTKLSPEADAETSWEEEIDVDIKSLQKLNPDVVGWIYVEGTDISYPILYSEDDGTYLRTAIDKEYSKAGSIFLEGYNLPDFSDSHNIIYGHNMKDLSMFGTLKYYKSKDSYYEKHKYFQIITADMKRRYEIFSYFDTEPASWVYAVPYYDNEDFQSYIDKLEASDNLDVNEEVTSSDKVVTLSTCSTDDKRFTMHGYQVDYTLE